MGEVAQVGGTHYGEPGSYKHWDLCEDYDIGYLEGNATKYVARWRKSAKPRQDLQKGLSYLVKMGGRDARRTAPHSAVARFTLDQGLQGEDARIMQLVLGNGRSDAIADAIDLIRGLLRTLPEGSP